MNATKGGECRDLSIKAPRNTFGCSSPIQTEQGLAQCRKCDMCKKRKRRHWLGRIAAEAFTSDYVRFVTLTYDDDHVGLGLALPREHYKAYCNKRRRRYRFRHFTVGEYGEKTGRPHWHSLHFYTGDAPSEAPGFSSKWANWSFGNSCYELPRSLAGSCSYIYDYLDKGGLLLRPSPGLGRLYLERHSRMLARNRRPLADQYGLPYTVPGVTQRDGTLWRYYIPSGHYYAPIMAECYLDEWRQVHDDEPDYSTLSRIKYDDN